MSPTVRSTAASRENSGPVIGILGGSFDPVHLGHLRIAERARDQVPCDEIWFLPAAIAPHKLEGPSASAHDRLEMLARAVQGRPGMRIEPIEIEAGVPRRTVQTLRLLAARHRGTRWRLVIGEDSWEAIDTWVEPGELLRLAPPVVQPRPGSSGKPPDLAARHPATWLRGDPIDVSSSLLRSALGRGESPPSLPGAVIDYVRTHGLYGVAQEGGRP